MYTICLLLFIHRRELWLSVFSSRRPGVVAGLNPGALIDGSRFFKSLLLLHTIYVRLLIPRYWWAVWSTWRARLPRAKFDKNQFSPLMFYDGKMLRIIYVPLVSDQRDQASMSIMPTAAGAGSSEIFACKKYLVSINVYHDVGARSFKVPWSFIWRTWIENLFQTAQLRAPLSCCCSLDVFVFVACFDYSSEAYYVNDEGCQLQRGTVVGAKGRGQIWTNKREACDFFHSFVSGNMFRASISKLSPQTIHDEDRLLQTELGKNAKVFGC